MKNKIISLAKEVGADIVGFASAQELGAKHPVMKLLPEAKTVIGLGFRVLRGIYRGIEEGSTYYQYTTMAVENMEETVMPMCQLRVSMMLEENGYIALPQRLHQQIMADENSTNPEVAYDSIYRGKTAETQLDFKELAVKCGIGEIGKSGAILCDEFGPFVRYCFIITDCEAEPSKSAEPHLCDGCNKCINACPGHAIDEKGILEPWRCSVYYNGASGLKNPFMPPYALEKFEDRLDIIAGEADISVEKAKAILNELYFYPPAQHAYQCSICGRACDVACYCHLEEKGVLTKKFNTPFRKREEWKFKLKDFE